VLNEDDTMTQRHEVSLRVSESAPLTFTTIAQTSVEGSVEWTNPSGPSDFKTIITQLAGRLGRGITGPDMANITITSRAIESVTTHPPVTDQDYAAFLDSAPGASLTVFMPIAIGEKRDDLEMWTVASRHVHGLSGAPVPSCGGTKFVLRLLGDQLLTLFQAGENRPANAEETFKKFAAQTGNRDEIWIRPSWRAAAWFPEPFAEKPGPIIDPVQLEAKARCDEMIAAKKRVRSMWASLGYTWNPQRLSWSPPAEK
jgi:hypothetical protein